MSNYEYAYFFKYIIIKALFNMITYEYLKFFRDENAVLGLKYIKKPAFKVGFFVWVICGSKNRIKFLIKL
jgi:hypothetical protein